MSERIVFYDDSKTIGGHQMMVVEIVKSSSKMKKIALMAYHADWYRKHLVGIDIEIVPIKHEKGPFTALRSLVSRRIWVNIKILRRLKATHLIVCQGAAEMGVGGLMAGKILKLKVVTYIPMATLPSAMNIRFASIRTSLQNIILRSFDVLITISETQLRQFVQRGVSFDRCKIIHNVVTISARDGVVPLIPAQDTNLTFTVIGRVDFSQKGQDKLIKISKNLREERIDHKFVIVGDGPDLPQLKGLVEAEGLKSQFQFDGWQDDKQPYFESSHFIVSTSNFEGVPLVLLESILNNKLFLANRIDPFPEYLPEEQMFVDPPSFTRVVRRLSESLRSPSLEEELRREKLLVHSLHSKEKFVADISSALNFLL